MEQSWDNWPLDAEVVDDKDMAHEQCHKASTDDDEEFLGEILQQTTMSYESESQSLVLQNTTTTTTTDGGSGSSMSSNEMEGSDKSSGKRLRPPRTYILSFDKSTIIPAAAATGEPFLVGYQVPILGTRRSSSNSKSNSPNLKKRNLELPKPKATQQGGKKTRSNSQSVDHIMAERKRRQELTQKFIALSATIPGLKKTDKTSIIGEAISYVKLLQERVTELEERNKRGKKSTIVLNKKSDFYANEDSTSCETSSEDCCELSFPDVKAKVLENEVLIEIHCEKEKGIELKILDMLESLHLFVTGSSVLPFGNSTLGITIIAQMGDSYIMTVNDLVKTLRQVLLNQTASK